MGHELHINKLLIDISIKLEFLNKTYCKQNNYMKDSYITDIATYDNANANADN